MQRVLCLVFFLDARCNVVVELFGLFQTKHIYKQWIIIRFLSRAATFFF